MSRHAEVRAGMPALHEALARQHEADAVAALDPWLHDESTRCILAQVLASGIADAAAKTGGRLIVHLGGLEQSDDPDVPTRMVAGIVAAVANHDHDTACNVFHAGTDTRRDEVLAALVNVTNTLVAIAQSN